MPCHVQFPARTLSSFFAFFAIQRGQGQSGAVEGMGQRIWADVGVTAWGILSDFLSA